MLTALYYPHTTIREEALLCHALLYWDKVEYISPFPHFDPSEDYEDPLSKEAARIILEPHIPTENEKRRAHDQIMELVSQDLPTWLQVDFGSEDEDYKLYQIYKYKLLPETWEELKARHLVKFKRHGDLDDYASHTYLGLTIMSILARSCAGTLKHTITDRDAAYGTLMEHLKYLSGNPQSRNPSNLSDSTQTFFKAWLNSLGIIEESAKNERREALINITLDVIDARQISLETLIRLRQDKSAVAAELRQHYSSSIESYVDQFCSPELTESDRSELTNSFQAEMENDLLRLQEEMRLTAARTLLTKELAVAAIAPVLGNLDLIASHVDPIYAGLLGVGALGKIAIEYRSARNTVFKSHPMAFLYKAKKRRLY